jgi:6-phosphogluconolactonase
MAEKALGRTVVIKGTVASLNEKAASKIGECISSLLVKKRRAVIAVPGGKSVAAIFRLLGKQDLNWQNVDIFLLDERLVPKDHPQSNYRLVHSILGSLAPEASIHKFCHCPDEPETDIRAYQAILSRCGGSFDLVLASSGEDGHIASLFPDHHALNETNNDFVLVNNSPKPPARRMSASAELIARAETGLLLFFGEAKRQALVHFFNSNLSFQQCPAKIISQLPTSYLLSDLEINSP